MLSDIGPGPIHVHVPYTCMHVPAVAVPSCNPLGLKLARMIVIVRLGLSMRVSS